MKSIKLAVLAGVVFGSFLGAILLVQPAAHAQDNQQQAQKPSQQAQPKNTYDYVAQAGDSYSVLARKAVQTFGLENKVNLSQAQIIAAETHLTIDADSPLLNEGQDVSFNKDTVKKWVDQVQKLTKAEQALWRPYVTGVDFDTRNNGE